jgi:hypothetical protein
MPSGDLLCIATGAGFIKIIDPKKGKIIAKEEYSRAKIAYDIDWGSQLIMVGCETNKV